MTKFKNKIAYLLAFGGGVCDCFLVFDIEGDLTPVLTLVTFTGDFFLFSLFSPFVELLLALAALCFFERSSEDEEFARLVKEVERFDKEVARFDVELARLDFVFFDFFLRTSTEDELLEDDSSLLELESDEVLELSVDGELSFLDFLSFLRALFSIFICNTVIANGSFK